MQNTVSAREGRARRSAHRQGLQVIKSRRQLMWGPYMVADLYRNTLESSEGGMGLDELETFLAS